MKQLFTIVFIMLGFCLTGQVNAQWLNMVNQNSKHITEVLDDNGRIIFGSQGSFNVTGMEMSYGETGEPLFLDGSSGWSALGNGLDNAVSAIAISGNNVYVGGFFTQAGGNPASNIAKWDGTTWSVLGSGVGQFFVSAIAISGSDVYAGGTFTQAGGNPANNIAKWDGTSWSALGSGVNSGVNTIAISGTDVYAGGNFTQAGGNPASRIAKWNGTSWSALGSGVNNVVNAIAISGTDVYAGGNFTQAGGNTATRIAKWNGTSWSVLGSGLNTTVQTIAISGSYVYAGGNFTQAGGNPASRIAKWDGTSWSALGSGLDNTIFAIAISGSYVYAGGSFTQAGGNPASGIATWDGTSWTALGSGVNNQVNRIAISGSDVYIGGIFTEAGGNPANRIAKYSIDGSSPAGASGNNVISGGGSVIFPTTAISILVNAGFGAGFVNVYRYEDAPSNVGGIPVTFVSNYRWIIQQTGLAIPFTGTMRISIDDIPGNGITNPSTVKVYHRPTPGHGDFTEIAGVTYDGVTGELVIPITTFSEFVFASEDNPLPVELSSFTASVDKQDVYLNWTTANEINNYGFEILRAQTTVGYGNWVNIGFIEGSGTTNETKNYSFTNHGLSTGKYNYRLKQIDYNGNFEYFNLSNEVIIGVPDKYNLSQNYPNPFNPTTKINFEIPVEGLTKLIVYDISGREVSTLVNEVVTQGYYTAEFNASSLSSGVYFYRLVTGNMVMTKHMVLIK